MQQEIMEAAEVPPRSESCAELQTKHHLCNTNIVFTGWPDALPVTQPTVSEH